MWHYWISSEVPCHSCVTGWEPIQLNHLAREKKHERALKESGGTIARRWSVQRAEQQMLALTSPRLKCPRQPHPAHKASTHNIVFALLGSPSVMDLHKLRSMCRLPAAESSSFSSSRQWSPSSGTYIFQKAWASFCFNDDPISDLYMPVLFSQNLDLSCDAHD